MFNKIYKQMNIRKKSSTITSIQAKLNSDGVVLNILSHFIYGKTSPRIKFSQSRISITQVDSWKGVYIKTERRYSVSR